MAHTYTNLLVHAVFSTKDRRPDLDAAVRSRLFPYLGGIVQSLHGKALIVNGTDDHVHTLLSLPATLAAADVMRAIKANSSRWVHETWPAKRDFAWQAGYGAFSVSHSNLEAVRKYIANQEEHHRRMTFQEEHLELLKRHGIAYDERYVWE